MARIKQILNERRLAYEQAVALRYEATSAPVKSKELTVSKGQKSERSFGRRRRRPHSAAVVRANSMGEDKSASEIETSPESATDLDIHEAPSIITVEAKV